MRSFGDNRVLKDTGAQFPIFNAPIGYIARGRLAGAVSAAGGMGLMELNTIGLPEIEAEYAIARAQSNRPLGVHMFIKVLSAQPEREAQVLDWVTQGRTRFVVSCVGDPTRYARPFADAGVKHYHQVGSLDRAMRAEDAGVDGLIVEGAESGGLRAENSQHAMVLLQAVRDRVSVPIIAAGGIVDGRGMAAAFALGAEGVVMGTRLISSIESPIHGNYKQAIADATGVLRTVPKPGITMSVVRNELSEAVARGDIDTKGNPYAGPFLELFNEGRLDRAMAGAGESAVLIDAVKPVSEIVAGTVDGFWTEIERLAAMLKAPG